MSGFTLAGTVCGYGTASPYGAHTTGFESRWRPELGRAVADGAVGGASNMLPPRCKLAVIGAGWGGVYTAWRLAIDTDTIRASDVCVFEANGRVGGRVFSVHDLPHFGDLAIDVGGYRFQESQRLPADLVFGALKLPTACYDYGCQSQCEGPQNCYILRDTYGNNAGYASVVERMLSDLEAGGATVWFGATLVSVEQPSSAYSGAAPNSTVLRFADGRAGVLADRVVLNLPANAIQRLDRSSVLFTDSPAPTVRVY